MEQKQPQQQPKPKGRPPAAQAKAPSIELSVEGDYLVIKVPKKDVSRKLLAELI